MIHDGIAVMHYLCPVLQAAFTYGYLDKEDTSSKIEHLTAYMHAYVGVKRPAVMEFHGAVASCQV